MSLEILLAGVKRIEELEHCPVGDTDAWNEIRAHSTTIARSGLTGHAEDLAIDVRFAIGHVIDSRRGVDVEDERRRLRGYPWRLRVELEEAILSAPR